MEVLSKSESMIGLEFETNNNGKCFIIKYENYKNVLVLFHNGEIVKTTMHYLKSGRVGKIRAWCDIGTIVSTRFHGDCEVVKYTHSKDVDVRFLDGTVVKVTSGNLKNGVVLNPNNPKIFGVAINDVPESTSTKFYQIWHSMIRRCYSEVYQKNKPNYKGVKVEPSWLRFSNFKNDVLNIPYSSYCDSHGYQMDKDIFSGRDKIYSKSTVCFIPSEINSMLIKSTRDGKYIGCYKHENRFIPSVRSKDMVEISKKLSIKASYTTEEEAVEAYKKVKMFQLIKVVDKYRGLIDDKVCDALVNPDFLN